LHNVHMQTLLYIFTLLGLAGLATGHAGAGVLSLLMGALTWYGDRAMAKLPTPTYVLCDETQCVNGMEHILAVGMVMTAMTADGY
jgi:hypothetical protein